MGYFSGGVHGDRTSLSNITKIIGIPLLLLAGCAIGAYLYCQDKVDRRYYEEELSRARLVDTVREMDAALLPKFEKEDLPNSRARYTARPKGTGICGCSATLVDVVDVTYDGGGQVVSRNVHQKVGMAKR